MGHPLSDVLASQERTLSWLGRKAGKSPSYVLRVINGERRPSEDFKVRAADALGVPVTLLFPESKPADVAQDERDLGQWDLDHAGGI